MVSILQINMVAIGTIGIAHLAPTHAFLAALLACSSLNGTMVKT